MLYLEIAGIKIKVSEKYYPFLLSECFYNFIKEGEDLKIHEDICVIGRDQFECEVDDSFVRISLINRVSSEMICGYHDILISKFQKKAIIEDSSLLSNMVTFSNDISCIIRHLLTSFNGFVIHASAVAYNGKAILFCADSGMGKSTQARLWENSGFGSIFNHDKPGIRLIDSRVYSYGMPWSGKDTCYFNVRYPLSTIVMCDKKGNDLIYGLTNHEKVNLLLRQIKASILTGSDMESFIKITTELIEKIVIIGMHCSKSMSAVSVLKQYIDKYSYEVN